MMQEIINKIRSLFKLTPASSLHVDRPIEKEESERDKLIKEYKQLVDKLNQIIEDRNKNIENKNKIEQEFPNEGASTFRGQTF